MRSQRNSAQALEVFAVHPHERFVFPGLGQIRDKAGSAQTKSILPPGMESSPERLIGALRPHV